MGVAVTFSDCGWNRLSSKLLALMDFCGPDSFQDFGTCLLDTSDSWVEACVALTLAYYLAFSSLPIVEHTLTLTLHKYDLGSCLSATYRISKTSKFVLNHSLVV